MSGREVISLHLGQGGIQMGASLWEQYCKEHKLNLRGVRKSKRYRMMQRLPANVLSASSDPYQHPYSASAQITNRNANANTNTNTNSNTDTNASNDNSSAGAGAAPASVSISMNDEAAAASSSTSSNPNAPPPTNTEASVASSTNTNTNTRDTDSKSNEERSRAAPSIASNASRDRNAFRKSITKKVPFEEPPIEDEDSISRSAKTAVVMESHVFFSHNDSVDSHCPRAVMVDLEANVIDDIKNSAFGTLFNPDHLINGCEDAANNYARGRYTVGAEIAPRVYEAIRKQVEECEHCQCFIFNQAVAGGTGSGFGGLSAEFLSDTYRKIPKISFAIYPSPLLSNAVVEPYNALLATHDLIDHNNITIILDNEAGYEICQKTLGIAKPSFFNVNRLIGKVASSVTSGIRFSGQQQFTVADLQTNLVPYPRRHFMTCGMGPILAENSPMDLVDEMYITDNCFRPDSMFTKFSSWDPDVDKYMGISLTYRGNCQPTKTAAAVNALKGTKVKLVDWCPTGFKISNIDKMPSYLGDDGLKPTDKTCVMIGNNVAIVRPFSQRIARKYDLMYSQRAFVHWYVGEGMEEGEFAEAREDLGMLIEDYLSSLNDQVTDEYDSDADEDAAEDD